MELQDHLTVAFYPSDQLVLTKDISVSLYLQKYDMEKKKKTFDTADFIFSCQGENMGEKDSLGFARQIQGISFQARAVNRNGSCGIREDCKNRNNYLRASGLGKGERPPASTYPRPLVFLKLQQGSITGLPCCSLAEQ